MTCPRKRKTCKQVHYRKFDEGTYVCSGILERKSKGGVKMDCIRICERTRYHWKKVHVFECTPEEALEGAVAYIEAFYAWLNKFKPYQKWREANDG